MPYFVQWVDGVPDHRIRDGDKLVLSVTEKRCWVCGDKLGRWLAFLIGPMCAVNRISSEPPAHRECAVYSAQACPFLTRPHAVRREAGLPEEAMDAPGIMLKRNPGVALLWITRSFRIVKAPPHGVLFQIGDPEETIWYREGRLATRAEVIEAIDSGLPILAGQAREDGERAMQALQRGVQDALRLVPAA